MAREDVNCKPTSTRRYDLLYRCRSASHLLSSARPLKHLYINQPYIDNFLDN